MSIKWLALQHWLKKEGKKCFGIFKTEIVSHKFFIKKDSAILYRQCSIDVKHLFGV